MAANLFRKYIWLVDAVHRHGPIDFAGINRLWRQSAMYEGRDIPLRTFHNHRDAVEELFHIRIACDERTNRYYIADGALMEDNAVTKWLLDSFSTSNLLQESLSLRDRILIDDIPSARACLTDILEAMRVNRKISVSYRRLVGELPFVLELQPLFVKLYQQRWYLYASKANDARIKVYALDRMQSINVLDDCFEMPAGFSPKEYMGNVFGISVYDSIKPLPIRIRAYYETIDYLNVLPLHPSQHEVAIKEDDGCRYADFEYFVAPTREFYNAIMALQSGVEILSPDSVRAEMLMNLNDMWSRYDYDEPGYIFLDVDVALCPHYCNRTGAVQSFSSEAVAALSLIVEQTGAAIVLTSQRWDETEAARIWQKHALPGKLMGVVDDLTDFYTGVGFGAGFGSEIDAWMSFRMIKSTTPYVIMCGECVLSEEQRPHFVQIGYDTGITRANAELATGILLQNRK